MCFALRELDFLLAERGGLACGDLGFHLLSYLAGWLYACGGVIEMRLSRLGVERLSYS
jgi:hypothetical protein